MSRRTADLPPLTGLPHVIREIRYSEFFRQALGLLLIPFYALLAKPLPISFAVGCILALIGTLVRLYASGFIVKNKQLATNGPYSLVRHPLYTGNLLLMIGFTFASGQWWALLISAAFWWIYYPVAIEYEDRKLHGLFGEAWEAWSGTVPAVIPKNMHIHGGGSWSFETSWKQNYEAIIVIYTIFWLVYISFRIT
ncbi:MAG: isoprenylcysteine carboxylmethyltransferase family protein [Gammaproteobacteria bacterium]|nr:isoprenylcysteine carboxylmethyltransferase family protein [Gammaproteobacteria bacterium]